MKKLLALFLCVMMFVAIIPTNAFAWEDKAVSNTAVKEAEKSIKNMYTAIATDELVFGTAKSLHDLFDGVAKSIFDGVDSMDNKLLPDAEGGMFVGNLKTVYHDDLVDNTRAYLKNVVGDAIADYISKRVDVFKSGSINGGVDPEKYLNVFVAAVNDAVSSEKAQAGLQAFIYDIYALKVRAARLDAFDDLADGFEDWGMEKAEEFGDSFVYNTLGREIWYGTDSFTNYSNIIPYGEYTDDDSTTNPNPETWTGAWAGNGSANMANAAANIGIEFPVLLH